jgi:hypothetical protein
MVCKGAPAETAASVMAKLRGVFKGIDGFTRSPVWVGATRA